MHEDFNVAIPCSKAQKLQSFAWMLQTYTTLCAEKDRVMSSSVITNITRESSTTYYVASSPDIYRFNAWPLWIQCQTSMVSAPQHCSHWTQSGISQYPEFCSTACRRRSTVNPWVLSEFYTWMGWSLSSVGVRLGASLQRPPLSGGFRGGGTQIQKDD